jgi:hypothetical protein
VFASPTGRGESLSPGGGEYPLGGESFPWRESVPRGGSLSSGVESGPLEWESFPLEGVCPLEWESVPWSGVCPVEGSPSPGGKSVPWSGVFPLEGSLSPGGKSVPWSSVFPLGGLRLLSPTQNRFRLRLLISHGAGSALRRTSSCYWLPRRRGGSARPSADS